MAQTPCSAKKQEGNRIPYTPVGAVTAHNVVVVGNFIAISIADIAAGVEGSLETKGVFSVPKVTGAVTIFQPLYYDADADPVSGTAGSGAFTTNSALGPYAGWALSAQDSGDASVDLYLCSKDAATATPRASLGQDDLKPYTIPLTSLRVHDAMITNLPGTAANDDMGLITGTPGTDAPTLQGVDFGGTSTDEKGAFEFILPAEYVSGETITVRIHAGMLTAVSDGTATVDVECWVAAASGAVGSDICATAAQSINSLTFANKDFTITPTSRVAGDRLIIRVAFAGSDTGNLAVMIPEITNIAVLCDVKG
jgi:predicted RecA/RadA family phage recombinase